jgi:TorA maturation chaperone TorD
MRVIRRESIMQKASGINEKTYENLMGINIAHSFFNKVFNGLPSADFIESLREGRYFDGEWFFEKSLESVTGIEYIKKYIACFSEKRMDELKDNYYKLFIGPGQLLAPPWESVYTEQDKTLFGKSTLEVRQHYRKNGLRINNINKEPDDHISHECAYMNYLSGSAAKALEKEDISVCERFIEEMRLFYGLHLHKWAFRFAEQVIAGSDTGFYCGVGYLLKGTVRETSDILNQVGN